MDDAIADYGRAIGIEPKNAVAYRDRGHAYKDKGDLDRAMADYNRAIELEPKSADTITATAPASRPGAISTAPSPAIATPSNSIRAWRSRIMAAAIADKAKGELARAIADYSRAIELDPEFPYAYVNRAAAHEASKDFGKALADRAKAAELRSKENESPWQPSLTSRSFGLKEAKKEPPQSRCLRRASCREGAAPEREAIRLKIKKQRLARRGWRGAGPALALSRP